MDYTNAFEMTQQEHKQEIKQQDEIVEDMLTTIKRLNVHAGNINIHIQEDNEILEDINNEIQLSSTRMEKATLKLDKLINTKSKKCTIIIVLLIILMVLIYFCFH